MLHVSVIRRSVRSTGTHVGRIKVALAMRLAVRNPGRILPDPMIISHKRHDCSHTIAARNASDCMCVNAPFILHSCTSKITHAVAVCSPTLRLASPVSRIFFWTTRAPNRTNRTFARCGSCGAPLDAASTCLDSSRRLRRGEASIYFQGWAATRTRFGTLQRLCCIVKRIPVHARSSKLRLKTVMFRGRHSTTT